MRVSRSFILLLGIAAAAAGCAQQPVASVGPPIATASSGVDNVVYGIATPAPRAAQPDASLPLATADAAAPSGRGLYAMVVPARNPAAARTADNAAPSTTGSIAAAPSPTGDSAAGIYAYAPTAAEGPYTLDSGDRLRIVVFGQEGLTNSYAVDASGHIAMPLIGAVPARSATTEQLSSRIAAKLRDGFIREPHVAVEIEAYRPFFILGEVTAPGQYPFVANMNAETAVAIAGGFTPRAFRKTVTLNRILNGRQERLTVPLTFALRPGDTINVQERWF